jgi:GNAT superfamily N-acetyltransferase
VLTVRPAGEPDTVALAAVADLAYRDYVPRIGRLPAPMTSDYANAIRTGLVWVAAADDEVIGLLVLAARPDHLLIENIAVLPSWQRRGIGARLMALAEDQVGKLGLSEITPVHERGDEREPGLLPGEGVRRDASGRAGRVQAGFLQQAARQYLTGRPVAPRFSLRHPRRRRLLRLWWFWLLVIRVVIRATRCWR